MSHRPSGELSAAEGWESFRAAVVSPAAGLIQRREMRRAFYAGVWHMLNVMRRIFRDDMPTGARVEILTRIDEECKAFNHDVQKGRA